MTFRIETTPNGERYEITTTPRPPDEGLCRCPLVLYRKVWTKNYPGRNDWCVSPYHSVLNTRALIRAGMDRGQAWKYSGSFCSRCDGHGHHPEHGRVQTCEHCAGSGEASGDDDKKHKEYQKELSDLWSKEKIDRLGEVLLAELGSTNKGGT